MGHLRFYLTKMLSRTVVNVSPRHRLDDDALETKGGSLPLTVALQGVCDFPEPGRLGVRVFVEIPYYDSDAEPPGTPDEPISDSDQFENVQLYFANEEICNPEALKPRPCYRILEIRFNRFSQYRLRLRSRPHNLLRDTDLPAPVILLDTEGLEQGDHSWRGNLTFEAELLPSNLTRIGVFVVDPTQPAGFPLKFRLSTRYSAQKNWQISWLPKKTRNILHIGTGS
ncbi:hypothetical protein B566_EDAN005530, partial [Ephemera danica]